MFPHKNPHKLYNFSILWRKHNFSSVFMALYAKIDLMRQSATKQKIADQVHFEASGVVVDHDPLDIHIEQTPLFQAIRTSI